jgi:hypothetical protein
MRRAPQARCASIAEHASAMAIEPIAPGIGGHLKARRTGAANNSSPWESYVQAKVLGR